MYSVAVKKNFGRGAKLGFPTANIEIESTAPEGVFVGYTMIGSDSLKMPSLIFIGLPEMFGDTQKRLESYILDFHGDLYGKEISVEIVKKLREVEKFVSAKELVENMKIDELHASEYFNL